MPTADDVRQALKSLTDEQLERGMRAFSHPPRMMTKPCIADETGCFVYEALGWESYAAAPLSSPISTLSAAYEGSSCLLPCVGKGIPLGSQHISREVQEWFHSECIRELAERGKTVEPVPCALQ